MYVYFCILCITYDISLFKLGKEHGDGFFVWILRAKPEVSLKRIHVMRFLLKGNMNNMYSD